MPLSWERGVSGLLTVAAVVIAGALVHREIGAVRAPFPLVESQRYEGDWRDILPAGRVVGDSAAPVRVVVFSDIECPFCKRFHETLLRAVHKYPNDIAYTFIHFPLPSHQSALGAARLVECASLAGKFETALDFMFANQGALGGEDWSWFAAGIGVDRHPEFESCLADTRTPELIERGLAAGASIGVRGTPVVFLNGWRYPGAPPDIEFSRAVDELVAGRPPYPDFPRSAVVASRP